MQFKHPEFLYALLLLLIPIIVHLFQLRRFQTVDFTNVKFLKRVIMQTRKSSQLKKWLTLITRILLLTFLILAFARPYFSKNNNLNKEIEYVIYLDNSFSMSAKGNNGELLKRAAQDLIEKIPEQQRFTLFTNNSVFKDVTINDLKNELIEISYSAFQLDYNAAVLKGNQLFSKDDSVLKQFVFISDFQKKKVGFNELNETTNNLHLVKLKPVNTTNISLDSLYINNKNELIVTLKSNLESLENLTVSLYEEENLIAKTAISNISDRSVVFTLSKSNIKGKVTIEDTGLNYDNVLYFNINEPSKINVLAINEADDSFLKRIYTSDKFNYSSSSLDQLNYSTISDQNLVILNEIDNLNASLNVALKSFTTNGGTIVIIPSNNITLNSYNQLLNSFGLVIKNISEIEKSITSINFDHPIFSNVFDNKVTNFQYPKVNSFYTINSNQEAILKFENEKAFLTSNSNIFVFASALNKENSNFINSPLIVPTFYNIGRQSLKQPTLYYKIGEENSIDIDISLGNDDIIKLENSSESFIPIQQTYSNKVTITTLENPNTDGVYNVVNKETVLQNISFNYNRTESNLDYYSVENLKNSNLTTSIPELFDSLKNDTNVNELWKWFVIFAMVFLILEMVILKYFK